MKPIISLEVAKELLINRPCYNELTKLIKVQVNNMLARYKL